MAKVLLEKLLAAHTVNDGQLLFEFELSAESLVRLVGNERTLSKKSSYLRIQAEYFFVMADFFSGRHGSVLDRFRQLEEQHLCLRLSLPEYYVLLEHAAGSAVVLGKHDEAKDFIQRIPLAHQTREVRALREMFRFFDETTTAEASSQRATAHQ